MNKEVSLTLSFRSEIMLRYFCEFRQATIMYIFVSNEYVYNP